MLHESLVSAMSCVLSLLFKKKKKKKRVEFLPSFRDKIMAAYFTVKKKKKKTKTKEFLLKLGFLLRY